MNDENTRVLGRTLAVEEMKDVSGAAPTAPLKDIITAPSADQTLRQLDSNTVADNA